MRPVAVLVAIVLTISACISALGHPVLAAGTTRAATPLLPSGFNFGLASQLGELGWMTSSGVPWAYRYQYLSGGVNTTHGWETWNSPPGQFATYYLQASSSNGYFPVFTYY